MNLPSALRSLGRWLVGDKPPAPTSQRRNSLQAHSGGHYDIAAHTRDNADAWAPADNSDSDRANSPDVRSRARNRSRLETDNNPSLKGNTKTIANFEVGAGPTVHVENENTAYARDVEARWAEWCEATNLTGKLWQMVYARVQDGESFARLGRNPNLRHPERLGEPMPVQLDFQPFEADRCYTLWLPYLTPHRIDGIWFDTWGNPTYYDILQYHPGGVFPMPTWKFDTTPAQFILHLFFPERPGQHRGMPEFSSSIGNLNLRRRWQHATVDAAETAAKFGVLLHTNMPPGEQAELGDTAQYAPLPRNNMTQLPEGWQAEQLKPEHPAQNFESFASETLNEGMRPASIPLNIAKCDSSRYNMASGQLDIKTFWVACGTHQRNNAYRIVNPLFRAWYAEARLVYQTAGQRWSQLDDGQIPARVILWQGQPHYDRTNEQEADERGLATGTIGMSDVWGRKGIDWRTRAEKNAKDLGFGTVEEYLLWTRQNLTRAKGGTGAFESGQADEDKGERATAETNKPAGTGPKGPSGEGADEPEKTLALAARYPALAGRLNGRNGHTGRRRHLQARAPFLEIPDIRQDTDYRCGAASAMAVGRYFRVGPETLDEWADSLGTTAQRSTSPDAIVSYLGSLGLAVTARHNLSVDDLAYETESGRPVIVCCQDYISRGAEPRNEAAEWNYGHWMVCLGVIGSGQNRYLIFQDSSEENMERLPGGDVPKDQEDDEYVVEEPGRRLVSEKRWLPAWHDEATSGILYDHYGIIVGLPENATPTAALIAEGAPQ